MQFIPFSSQTRMSGVDYNKTAIRKGAAEAVFTYMKEMGNQVSEELIAKVDQISRSGGTPLVVTESGKALGVIYLKGYCKRRN